MWTMALCIIAPRAPLVVHSLVQHNQVHSAVVSGLCVSSINAQLNISNQIDNTLYLSTVLSRLHKAIY